MKSPRHPLAIRSLAASLALIHAAVPSAEAAAALGRIAPTSAAARALPVSPRPGSFASAASPAATLGLSAAPAALAALAASVSPISALASAPILAASPEYSSEADAVFDGDSRVYLKLPGQEAIEAPLDQLESLLAAHPGAREDLARRGRVRLVLPGSEREGERSRALLERLKAIGVERGVDLENLTIEGSSQGSDPAAAAAPAPKGPARVPHELRFLTRQLRDSFHHPSRREAAGGLLSAVPGFTMSMIAFGALLLPGYWPAFAGLFVFTVGLKLLHNVYVNSWTEFQNRVGLLRGNGYLTTFNFLYGQTVAALYRTISWAGQPGVIPPWDPRYWRDLSIMSVIGTVVYTLGNIAVNDLYNKGVLSQRQRAYVQQARALIGDVDGVFFKLGWMVPFWIAFVIHQAVDLAIYPLASMQRARPILYVAPAEVAATAAFRSLYLQHAAPVSTGRRLLQALLDAPFVAQAVMLGRWIARKAGRAARVSAAAALITPQTLAAEYARGAAAGAELSRPEAAARLPLLRTVLGEDGKARRVGGGISQPVLVRLQDGSLGVFKRSPSQGMSASDPNYKYERLKLAADVVGSYVMEKMGAPTVRYSMARAVIDGREYTGVITPYLEDFKTGHQDPQAAESLSNRDEFTRGLVLDAWLGNTDRISGLKNLWLVPDGRGGRKVLFGDYDQAMRQRSSLFGVPKLPIGLFSRLARPEVARRTIADVAALPDATIRAWVDEALAGTAGFGDPWRGYLQALLIYNRDHANLGEAVEAALSGRPQRLRLRGDVVAALGDKVLGGRGRAADLDAAAEEALRPVLYLSNHPELRAPMKALLKELARRRLAGDGGDYEPDASPEDMLPALVNFVWAHFTPEEAIARGIAYNR